MTTSCRRPGPNLIVVGATARAFACSARRAGWSVHAADLFGDADLRAAATTVVAATGGASGYPTSLLDAVATFPRVPWCYTGALENHPQLIATLSATRPLLGTSPAAARAVRSPRQLADVVRGVSLGFPDTFFNASGVPRDGTFIVKPLASAGGRGIARWDPATGHRDSNTHLWQRRIDGESWTTAFVIDRHGLARLWGASRQLVGLGWCHARPYAYCGSLDVPLLTLPPQLRSQFDRLGRALAEAFAALGLIGLIGADLVVDPSGHVHVIEINPRPTASMELVERSTGESLAAVHLRACGAEPPLPRAVPRALPWLQGKAVLFAPRDILIDAGTSKALQIACRSSSDTDSDRPALADIPCTGTSIPGGAPLLTIFAAGDGHADLLDRLQRRAAAVEAIVSAGQTAGHRHRRPGLE